PHTAVAVRPFGSWNRGVLRTTGPHSQWFDIPLRHHQQLPHAGETEARTRSPTLTRRTSAPTASTWPQASWPGMVGPVTGASPLITVRSVWHMPLAGMRTRPSRDPTTGVARSSTVNGWPASYDTATLIWQPRSLRQLAAWITCHAR